MKSIRDWFEASISLGPSERLDFLESNCADPAVRAQVEQLIATYAHTDKVLDINAVDIASRLLPAQCDAAAASWIGRSIGQYLLTGIIGHGGSSVVYSAQRDQDGITQQFAVKLYRKTLLTEEEQRRFRRERQALAALDHPSITRLLDGGMTESGFPFIVLELVRGKSITEYAREKGLGIKARVQLVVSVCRAVQTAHQALIVHRDLKPTNVLIAEDGHAKLLDFGIAKFLEESGDQTETAYRSLTPAYAAPEQFSSAAITTATDVYALGIVLFELLTGSRPESGRLRAPSEQISVNTGHSNSRTELKHLGRQVRGDLDNIVLKAMALEPARRYASAGAMADDLERYMASQPVLAHPPSRRYRARKFVTRHVAALSVASLASVAILGCLVFAWLQAAQARSQAHRAMAVSDFTISIFEAAQADRPRAQQPSIAELVAAANKRIVADKSIDDATRVDLLLALTRVCLTTEDRSCTTGLIERARSAIATLGAATDAQQLEFAWAQASLAHSTAHFNEAIALLEPFRSQMVSGFDRRRVDAANVLGIAYFGAARRDEARALAADMRNQAAMHEGDAPMLAQAAYVAEANLLVASGEFRQGLERCEAALAFTRRAGLMPNSATLWLQESIGNAASSLGQPDRADRAYREALLVADQLYEKPHPDKAWVLGVFGGFLLAQGRVDEAQPHLEKALAMRLLLDGENHPDAIFAMAGVARLRSAQGRRGEALEQVEKSVAACRRTNLQHAACARALALRATLHGMDFDRHQVDSDIDDALAMQRGVSGDRCQTYSSLLVALAEVRCLQGQYASALEAVERALAIMRAAKGGYWLDELQARYWRAYALYATDHNDAALDEVTDVEAKLVVAAPQSVRRAPMMALKAMALHRANRNEEARVLAREALAPAVNKSLLLTETITKLQHLAEMPN